MFRMTLIRKTIFVIVSIAKNISHIDILQTLIQMQNKYVGRGRDFLLISQLFNECVISAAK